MIHALGARDRSGCAWLLVAWAAGMVPTTIWVWIDEWPGSCAWSGIDWAPCLGELLLLAVLSALYGFFWPVYWIVRLAL